MSGTILTVGTQGVDRVLKALGGEPPVESGKRALQALDQEFVEAHKSREKSRAEINPLANRAIAAMLEPLSGSKQLADDARKMRDLVAQRSKLSLPRQTPRKVEPRIIAGSTITTVKGPPYVDAWQSCFGSHQRTGVLSDDEQCLVRGIRIRQWFV
jgi:hypothetical protein